MRPRAWRRGRAALATLEGMASTSERILALLRSLAGALLSPGKTTGRTSGNTAPARPGSKPASRTPRGPKAPQASRVPRATNRPAAPRQPQAPGSYPGDFTGTAAVVYAPKPDGAADPGEVVWTWVPYEEDHSQGKDRPVLLVGRDKKWLLALMLTSKDHTGDDRSGRSYVDIGTGAWDRQGRPSEAKLDRIIRVDPNAMRREGAVLDAKRFAAVAHELRTRHGWR